MTKRHTIRVRVYYEDTDAGGIVYHANYLRYFERARSEWLRALSIDHRQLAADGYALVVRDCSFQYHQPARLDDCLQVHAEIGPDEADLRRASVRFVQRAVRDDDEQLLVSGLVRVACVDATSGRPVAFPENLYARMRECALGSNP